MTVMYSFCLWFPVRLGAIIVAVTCAVESFACLLATLVGEANIPETKSVIKEWLSQYDWLGLTALLQAIHDDPGSFLAGFIVVFCVHIFSCVLLIVGAFRCILLLIYPFVGLEFLRLLALSILLIMLLLIIKFNTLTLGLVIAGSIFGGFILLYLWYQWFCVVSLCQIIKAVQDMEDENESTFVFNAKNTRVLKELPKPQNPKIWNDPSYFGLPPLN